nr:HD-GYP domain-containing protein [Synergistaceae bacterium]HPQ37973.1 HD-GYP domain-containing protein [Synergistaceae bacterium]
SESVALVGSRIARQLGLSKEEVEQTYWAGLVHDIGKILIPKEILNKPTPLSPEEYALIQEHPLLGCTMLSKMERLEKIAPFVLSHHEYWNGKGYPYNLEGEEIPLISRILSVADAWDAMTSNRSYREALSEEVACGEILAGKGTQFDPRVVEAFFSVMKNVSKEEPLS